MEITLNPFISVEARVEAINEIKDMLQDYDVTFTESQLLGKIRL